MSRYIPHSVIFLPKYGAMSQPQLASHRKRSLVAGDSVEPNSLVHVFGIKTYTRGRKKLQASKLIRMIRRVFGEEIGQATQNGRRQECGGGSVIKHHDRGQDRKAVRTLALLLNAAFWFGSEVAIQVEASVQGISVRTWRHKSDISLSKMHLTGLFSTMQAFV